ncbi:MAG: nitroreductase family protein [Aquiluna sp.]|nr:nitroreductase family protein [Aquiluna sp.]
MTSEPIQKPADTSANLHPLVGERWSPRIFDTSYALDQNQTLSLAEAFRWSPSSSNEQPWHVVLLHKETALFEEVSATGLGGFNASWAPNSSAYAIVLADQKLDGNPRDMDKTYFDAGLAASQLVTQAEAMGLRAHYMGGINRDEILKTLQGRDREVVCVIAIGKQGSLAGQTDELIARETTPRERKDPAAVYTIDGVLS